MRTRGQGLWTILLLLSGCAAELDRTSSDVERSGQEKSFLGPSLPPIDDGPSPLPVDPGTVPLAPAHPFAVFTRTTHSVTLLWTDRTSNEDTNEVWRSTIDPAGGSYGSPFGADFERLDELGPLSGQPRYVDDTLAPDMHYCYFLRTVRRGQHVQSRTECTYDPKNLYTGPRNEPHPRRDTFSGRARLLSQNIYGTRDGLLNNSHCEERMEGIGNFIAQASPPFDVLALQELYGTLDADVVNCESGDFLDAMHKTGRYPAGTKYQPAGKWFRAEGGMALFSRTTLLDGDSRGWSQNRWGRLDTPQGVVFGRIAVPDSDVTLDVYNVHVDANVDGADELLRHQQFSQLSRMIHEKSATSGNPVLVMGDFNTGGPPSDNGNDGYENIMEQLRHPIDFWKMTRPDSDGFTHEGQRIDFIFHVVDPYLTNSPYQLVVEDLKTVIQHATDGRVASDHNGLDLTVSFHRRCPYTQGHENYCNTCGPCDAGESDCDHDDECRGALICRANVGADYGLPPGHDVCECPWDEGHPHYCRDCGPCEVGEGDCDTNDECRAGLACDGSACRVYMPPQTPVDPKQCYDDCIKECLMGPKSGCVAFCNSQCR